MFTASFGIFLFGLIAAAAGGALGAAIGGNYAFGFTGLMILAAFGVLAATGSDVWFNYVAFGPFFGPHVAFAGGAAAAAYAANAKHYKVPNAHLADSDVPQTGKDVSEPLARLNRPDVLLVGSLFGMAGYAVKIGIDNIPWLGSHTDTVALTVIISGIAARLAFGGSLMNPEKYNAGATSFFEKIAPNAENAWLRYQERPSQFITIGVLFGMAAGAVSIAISTIDGFAAWAQTLPFAMSAVVIFWLILGHQMPVQHHATIIAGLFAVKFFPILVGGSEFNWQGAWLDAGAAGAWDSNTWMMAAVTVLLAGVAGAFSMALAELSARLFYDRGNNHIDPPAMAIWISTILVLGGAGLFNTPTLVS